MTDEQAKQTGRAFRHFNGSLCRFEGANGSKPPAEASVRRPLSSCALTGD